MQTTTKDTLKNLRDDQLHELFKGMEPVYRSGRLFGEFIEWSSFRAFAKDF